MNSGQLSYVLQMYHKKKHKTIKRFVCFNMLPKTVVSTAVDGTECTDLILHANSLTKPKLKGKAGGKDQVGCLPKSVQLEIMDNY